MHLFHFGMLPKSQRSAFRSLSEGHQIQFILE